MVCKIVSLFVCAVIMLQNIEAAYLKETKEASAEMRRAAQIKLSKFVMNELDKIAKIKMQNSQKLADSLLNDPKVQSVKTNVMESYLKDFRQFIENWKNHGSKRLLTFGRVDTIMSEETELFKKYTDNNETKEAVIISEALRKHGVDNQLKLLEEPTMKFTNDFIPEAENYINVLGETKTFAEEKAAFIDLIKQLKSEENAKKRGDIIMYYVQSFEFETDETV